MIDISSKRFGRLTAVKTVGRHYGRFIWECICDCGKTVNVDGNCLRTGNTKSCGCLASELTADRNHKHGQYGTAEYRAWSHMLSRCNNPNVERYPNYGGRGIKVCERWSTFENFLADMGTRPSSAHSIGRRNNDGDYEPRNCRWETQLEQQNNRSDSRLIAFQGRIQTLSQWSREFGFNEATIRHRIDALGWTIGRALTQPTR